MSPPRGDVDKEDSWLHGRDGPTQPDYTHIEIERWVKVPRPNFMTQWNFQVGSRSEQAEERIDDPVVSLSPETSQQTEYA
jgi:hypothetical protein